MPPIMIYLLTFFLINSQFAYAAQSLTDQIKSYNTHSRDVNFYISKYQQSGKWENVAKYLEQNKNTTLPQIKVANEKMYYFKTDKTVIQFSPQMATAGKIFVGKTPITYLDPQDMDLMSQINASIKDPSASMATLILIAEGIITPSSEGISKDPQFVANFRKYNQQRTYPESFISSFQTKEDSEHFMMLLEKSGLKELPPLTKLSNGTFMMEVGKAKDKVYFTENSIKRGILKINNREIDFSSATNLKEVTDILKDNMIKKSKSSTFIKIFEGLLFPHAHAAIPIDEFERIPGAQPGNTFSQGNWLTVGAAVAAMAGIFAIAKYNQNKKKKNNSTSAASENKTPGQSEEASNTAAGTDNLGPASKKYRVIVSSDIGGQDPDDFQSMVHYLMYSDRFITEGLISSPPGAGRASHIQEVINAYTTDYPKLKAKGDYPAPETLASVVKQGATDSAGDEGFGSETEGSKWIIEKAKASEEPLYILVWGSITDVAQALHDDPSIKPKLRVYYVGSWNTQMDPKARDYAFNNHSDLWMIETNSTFRGMYNGGNQEGDLGNTTFVEQHIKGHGALGDLFANKKSDIKMGDTPSVLYMLKGDPEDPSKESWGGQFSQTGHGPKYFSDMSGEAVGEHNGANTVAKWREEYLRDWQKRMEYLK